MRGSRLCFAIALSALLPLGAAGQVTGLEGWDIFIDPGHSQYENMGVLGYSEAEKNLAVARELYDLLMTTTDIDTVFLSRDEQTDQVSLSARSDLANHAFGTNQPATWFHSLHSNAGGSTANSVLMLWGQYRDGREKIPNGGQAMSAIMLDNLSGGMRLPWTGQGSYGDCSFYGCSSSGPYLSVNRRTDGTMPSELSEAGFHTNPTQNQRNMSASWKRMEAYTFYWSILDLHGIARPSVGIATGYITDIESGTLINGATAISQGITDTTNTVYYFTSLNLKYSGDLNQLRNGFFFLEGLAGSAFEIIFSGENYYPDTVNVTRVNNFFTFADVSLVSSRPPTVAGSYPAEGDSLFPAWGSISINFSRPMNPATVGMGLDGPTSIEWAISWVNGNRQMIVTTDSLEYLTNYTFTVYGTSEDAYGHLFDGNGDGTGGDSLTVSFRTGPTDLAAPIITQVYPRLSSTGVELRPIVSIEFDESLDPSTVTVDQVSITDGAGSAVPLWMELYNVAGRGVIQLSPQADLLPNTRYIVTLQPGTKDLLGNELTAKAEFRFTTGVYATHVTSIADFEGAFLGDWWDPAQSGSSSNYLADYTGRNSNSTVVNPATLSENSLQFNYGWDTTATTWLLREYLDTSAPARSVRFDANYVLQAFVFGDGSGNRVRFVVDDNTASATAVTEHEVSPWTTIDWIGWKLVSWDMTNEPAGSWLGDGILGSNMEFDSIQLGHSAGATSIGTLYFDDLRVVTYQLLAVDPAEDILPSEIVLHPNYPNPFNPTTNISFSLPSSGAVDLRVYDMLGRELSVLVRGFRQSGHHQAVWDGRSADGRSAPSGVYIARLTITGTSKSIKMILLK